MRRTCPPRQARTRDGTADTGTGDEDDVDAQVREDLDRWEREGRASFVGDDGPRWVPATWAEALAALAHFVRHRLPHFGPTEDAMLGADPWMAHNADRLSGNSRMRQPLNGLGRLRGREELVAQERERGDAPP